MSADGAGLPPFDLEFVRAQFPAFDEGGDPVAFMENAGGSYAARATVERLTQFYTRTKVQPYGPFAASAEAGAA
ncbi:MAG: nitrogen fixation protein NifS, partial [Pseudomonadota bacterium]